jgi:hypothetical protein
MQRWSARLSFFGLKYRNKPVVDWWLDKSHHIFKGGKVTTDNWLAKEYEVFTDAGLTEHFWFYELERGERAMRVARYLGDKWAQSMSEYDQHEKFKQEAEAKRRHK